VPGRTRWRRRGGADAPARRRHLMGMKARLWFAGVTTGQSFIHLAFPLWMDDLGRDVRLAGRDLPLGASRATYRGFVRDLAGDPSAVGAVITAHKVGIFAAARDLFSSLDELASECREINAIRRDGGGLAGFARDPLSVGWQAARIWPGGDHAVCLGAGGTAIALGRHLLSRTAPPARMVFTDRSVSAGRRLRSVLGHRAAARRVELVIKVGEGPWDEVVAAAPAGALIVNATGLGKDRPGAPVSAGVGYPARSVVWDLNYRGDLIMLGQARDQASSGGLRVHDGWGLFCDGWAAALGPVLGTPGGPAAGQRFAEVAASLRPKTGPAGGGRPVCPG